jgi:hypothetical protein
MHKKSLEHGFDVGNITNALSVLRLQAASPSGTNLPVTWQSVAGLNFFLERSTNLSANPPLTLLPPNLPGHPGTTPKRTPTLPSRPASFTVSECSISPTVFFRLVWP